MDPDLPRLCFVLGLRVAERCRGEEEMIETLRAVADGTLTLVDTPEEVALGLGMPDDIRAGVLARLHQLTREGMDAQRRAARAVLESMAE